MTSLLTGDVDVLKLGIFCDGMLMVKVAWKAVINRAGLLNRQH
jgi:hypothetical protein